MMMGYDEPYRGIPFFWTEQAGESLKYVGESTKWNDVVFRGSLDEGEFLAGYYADNMLKAACASGMDEELLAFRRLLESSNNPRPEELKNADSIAALA